MLSLCFLGGVFAASFFDFEKSFLLILVAGAVAVLVVNFKNKKALIVSAAILFFVLGFWRTSLSLGSAKRSLFGEKLGPVMFNGLVIREPEMNEKYQKLMVKNEDLEGKKEKILINTDVFRHITMAMS